MHNQENNQNISIIKILAAGIAILILTALLYNPVGILNGILDALK